MATEVIDRIQYRWGKDVFRDGQVSNVMVTQPLCQHAFISSSGRTCRLTWMDSPLQV